MWNNGRNGEFTNPMGQESIVKSSTIAEVKTRGITEDSPFFDIMIKTMSEFDKLEERMFGTPIATSPHAAHISESVPTFSQPQYERPFHYDLDQHDIFVYDNQSELASLALETDRGNSGVVNTKLPAKRSCYFDQHDGLILKSQSKLVSSAPETNMTNL
jgi:hypothetical protein